MSNEHVLSSKMAKAKLYNLKSGIDGIIQLIDAGVLLPDQVADAAAALVANMVKESSNAA